MCFVLFDFCLFVYVLGFLFVCLFFFVCLFVVVFCCCCVCVFFFFYLLFILFEKVFKELAFSGRAESQCRQF